MTSIRSTIHRALCSTFVVLSLWALPYICLGWSVELWLNKDAYSPQDRLVLKARIVAEEAVETGRIYLSVEIPQVESRLYSRVYLPLRQYVDLPSEGRYASPMFENVHVEPGEHEVTLFDGAVTEVFPMVTGIGTYCVRVESWDQGFAELAAVSFELLPSYPLLFVFEYPPIGHLRCGNLGDTWFSTGCWRYTDRSRRHLEHVDGCLYLQEDDQLRTMLTASREYLIDAATDFAGNTWLLLGEAYWYLDVASLPRNKWFEDERFLVWDGNDLVERPEIEAALPGYAFDLQSDAAGRVWILSGWEEWPEGPDDALCMFDGESVHVYPLSDSPRPGVYATELVPDPDGIIYVPYTAYYGRLHAYREGVLYFDGTVWDVYDEASSPLWEPTVECFYVDSRNRKWFGTKYGLLRYDGIDWECFTTDNSPLPCSQVNAMAYDQERGALLISSCEGMYRGMSVLWDGGEWWSYLSRPDDNEWDFEFAPRYFGQDAEGNWWLSPESKYRIYRYDGRELRGFDFRDYVNVFEWAPEPFEEETYAWWEESTFAYRTLSDRRRQVLSDSAGRTVCVTYTSVMIW